MGFGINVYGGHRDYWSKEVQNLAIALEEVIRQDIDINVLAAEFIQETFQQHPMH